MMLIPAPLKIVQPAITPLQNCSRASDIDGGGGDCYRFDHIVYDSKFARREAGLYILSGSAVAASVTCCSIGASASDRPKLIAS